MKAIILFLVLSIPTLAYADRVLIRKSDGFPIEYQSGDAPLGTLRDNHPEYQPAQIEERTISTADYQHLFADKIDAPAKSDVADKKEQARARIKAKLKLTDSDLDDLKTAL